MIYPRRFGRHLPRSLLSVAAGIAWGAAGEAHAAPQPEPLWAYGVSTPPKPGDKAVPQTPPSRKLRANEDPAEQTKLRHVAGSTAAYSRVDVRDGSNVIDWFPGDHPPMTNLMRHGPASLGAPSRGCASCHLQNGKGRPENAPVSGLPVAYFIRQMEDFQHDLRASADPRKPNTPTMTALAKAMSAEEIRESAEYFGAIKWTPWIRVVETDLVPKTKIEGNLHLAIEEARTEPIAGRIIETPEDQEQAEGLRNPHSGFIAYVPVGSVKKGKNLVTTGGMTVVDGEIQPGKTLACATCHGPDLMGLADVPGIAGRSPSYLVRQMYDLQQGTRKGPSAPLMQPVVAQLNGDDLVAIAAYVSSLAPTP
ncbi:MAG: cytochrome C-binding protein [Verrucomicrobia bacterium]|nr:cytochrome C-binding protein [Verrucomicrobiota bacterium]